MNPCYLILLWDSYFPLCFVTSRHWDSIEAESPAPMQLLLDQTQSKRKTRGTSGIRRSTIRTIARLRENPSGHCWLPWEVNWQLQSSMEPGLPAQENMPAETGLFSCWWSFVQEPSLVKCYLVVISYMGLSGNEVYHGKTIFLTIKLWWFPSKSKTHPQSPCPPFGFSQLSQPSYRRSLRAARGHSTWTSRCSQAGFGWKTDRTWICRGISINGWKYPVCSP